MSPCYPLPPEDQLRRLFSYQDDGALIWRVTLSSAAPAGRAVGSVSHNGYLRTRISGRNVFVHRVVLAMHGVQVDDGMVVDHINGDRLDNRIENLRVVPFAQNLQNRSRANANNSTNVLGVSLYGARYKASIRVQGEDRQRVLGYFDTIDEARSAYLSAKAELHPGAIIWRFEDGDR
jgi:hypothetical protein